ncbi:MAG: ATP-binding cassette domain-containing protein [Paenibacillaceae bacterium]
MPNDLQAINLSLSLDDKLVLKAITHQFRAGTVTLILGRSGSGKTMLLEALSGLRELEHGNVFIGDSPLWKGVQSKRKLQRQTMLLLGIGFQHPEQQLFAQTVEAEIRYNLRPYQLSSEQQKQRIQASSFLNSEQSDDWLKLDPFKLSGGQKRRLTLALMEATAPDWLLLDEPTSGVDAAGVLQLCQQLKRRQALGQGTIAVTHDLDGLIEAADYLVLMKDGQVFWSGTPAELLQQPHILEATGLVLSSRMETKRMLQQAGFIQPSGWPDARTFAEAIALQLAGSKARDFAKLEVNLDSHKPILDFNSLSNIETEKLQTVEVKKPKNRLKSFDPRTIWLTYILLSSGILLQSRWYGWAVSGFVTLGIIQFTKVPFKVWSRPALGLIIFAWIAALLSGIILGAPELLSVDSIEANGLVWQLTSHIYFAVEPASFTFYHFSRLVMIMLIGFVLLSGMNHLLLKRALEQSLHGLRYLRLPIEQFALTAALMICFLPLLMNEWERFARIAAARGKYAVRPGRIPIRGLRMTVIPYLMSLIRLGELLSLILIIRGIGLAGRKETRMFRLTFQKADFILFIAALGILLTLILVSRIS